METVLTGVQVYFIVLYNNFITYLFIAQRKNKPSYNFFPRNLVDGLTGGNFMKYIQH